MTARIDQIHLSKAKATPPAAVPSPPVLTHTSFPPLPSHTQPPSNRTPKPNTPTQKRTQPQKPKPPKKPKATQTSEDLITLPKSIIKDIIYDVVDTIITKAASTDDASEMQDLQLIQDLLEEKLALAEQPKPSTTANLLAAWGISAQAVEIGSDILGT